MRGGECVDVRKNYTTIKGIMLFVCGCYGSKLCLRVIRGLFIPTILLKKLFNEQNEIEPFNVSFATVTLMITP